MLDESDLEEEGRPDTGDPPHQPPLPESTSSSPLSLPVLPLELVLAILAKSAWSSSTKHARNVCLVNRAAYRHCRQSLYRVVVLRNRKSVRALLDTWEKLSHHNEDEEVLRQRIEACEYVYLNNNRQELYDAEFLKRAVIEGKEGKIEMRGAEEEKKVEQALKQLLSKAKVLQFEEFWSVNYPWDSMSERPILSYPLTSLVEHVEDEWWSKLQLCCNEEDEEDPQKTREELSLQAQRSRNLSKEQGSRDAEICIQHVDGQHDVCQQSNIPNLNAHFCLRRSSSAAPEELTISALAMHPGDFFPSPRRLRSQLEESTYAASASAAPPLPSSHVSLCDHGWPSPWTRLHTLTLNFAKMDHLLVAALKRLPNLRNLKLSRPFTNFGSSNVKLVEVARSLLGLDPDSSKRINEIGEIGGFFSLQTLIIESGPYMDAETIRSLSELAAAPEAGGRFHHYSSAMSASLLRQHQLVEETDTRRESSSSRAAIDWVISSEERAFQSFCDRINTRSLSFHTEEEESYQKTTK